GRERRFDHDDAVARVVCHEDSAAAGDATQIFAVAPRIVPGGACANRNHGRVAEGVGRAFVEVDVVVDEGTGLDIDVSVVAAATHAVDHVPGPRADLVQIAAKPAGHLADGRQPIGAGVDRAGRAAGLDRVGQRTGILCGVA